MMFEVSVLKSKTPLDEVAFLFILQNGCWQLAIS
jgi:hypothetical protein